MNIELLLRVADTVGPLVAHLFEAIQAAKNGASETDKVKLEKAEAKIAPLNDARHAYLQSR